jgi:zinc transport system substrate-binding protein
MFRKFTIAILLMALAGCGASEKKNATEIIAGTSLIADIISDLTDASVGTYTLLPSASCPSQFDMKASDIGRLQEAQLMFLHPWQLQSRQYTPRAGCRQNPRRPHPHRGGSRQLDGARGAG